MELHHISLRIDNALDQRGQSLECVPFLCVEFVPIVHAANAADYVAKAALGVIARDPARLMRERAVRRKS